MGGDVGEHLLEHRPVDARVRLAVLGNGLVHVHGEELLDGGVQLRLQHALVKVLCRVKRARAHDARRVLRGTLRQMRS